ncbi:MAG: hypothetical protein ACD_43C00030G0007 [uncultured bacterium]|nr:MAG: hypothetical protein ACD_43C00030G0007 [uncultured bacterium]
MAKHLETILSYGIVFFILLLPWQTHYELIPGINNLTTINLYGFDIVLVILLIVFTLVWYRRNSTFDWLPLLLGLGVIVLTLFSAYWAEDKTVAFYYWLHLSCGLGLMAIISHSYIKLTTIGWTLVTTGLLQTTAIIWQWCTQNVTATKWLGIAEQLAWESGPAVVVTAAGRWLRAYGTMPHPNSAAGWMLLALFAALWLWSLKPALRQRNWLMLCAALLTTGLVLTFSRTAIVVFGLVLVSGWFVTKINRQLIGIMAGTGLILGICLWPLVTSRLQPQLTYIEQLSLTERVSQYKEASQLFLRYWPTGVGIGQYTIAHTNKQQPQRQPVHNVPFMTIIELGIFGTVCWYAFIIYLLVQALTKSARSNGVVRWLALSLIALLIMSLFDHYLWTNFSLFYGFCLLLGLISKYTKISQKTITLA